MVGSWPPSKRSPRMEGMTRKDPMPHLALSPKQLAAIDFDTFEFPKLRVILVTHGATLIAVSSGSGPRLFNGSFRRKDDEAIAEIRAEVARFNADPISGWRDLFITTNEQENAVLTSERDALLERRRVLARAYDDAGAACLRARREARSAVVVS